MRRNETRAVEEGQSGLPLVSADPQRLWSSLSSVLSSQLSDYTGYRRVSGVDDDHDGDDGGGRVDDTSLGLLAAEDEHVVVVGDEDGGVMAVRVEDGRDAAVVRAAVGVDDAKEDDVHSSHSHGHGHGRSQSQTQDNDAAPSSEQAQAPAQAVAPSEEDRVAANERSALNRIHQAAARSSSHARHVGRFVVLLLVMLFLEHWPGVVTYLCFNSVLVHLDGKITLQGRLRRDNASAQGAAASPYATLFVSLMISAGHTVLLYMMGPTHDNQLRDYLLLRAPRTTTTFTNTLWTVAMYDLLLRFASLTIRCTLMLAFGDGWASVPKRKMHILMSRSMDLYRSVLPMPIWYTYFDQSATNALVRAMLPLAYTCSKWMALKHAVVRFIGILLSVFTCQPPYGSYIKTEEALDPETGRVSECIICTSEMVHPVRLHCSHVFCDECICTWLERKDTCPVCRARVGALGGVVGGRDDDLTADRLV